MRLSSILLASSAAALTILALPGAALAQDADDTQDAAETVPADARPDSGARPPVGAIPPGDQQGPPQGFDIVFDETWATIGIGAGLVPSYSGSNDYVLFPLPLIAGRVAGIGVSPNGPGFALDVLSKPPSFVAPETSVSFGPAFRFRNDRDGQFGDDVVELAGDLDTAIEVGAQGGVTLPGVFARFDRLSIGTQVRWDIAGAHEGMLIEPSVSYFKPMGRGASLQVGANLSFVDDNFADYYYSVTPAQSAATGLAQFTADGGLNSVGTTSVLTFDLDGNSLNGGFSIYSIIGLSRLVGDAADTPFTSERGSATQFLGGIGLSYTF